MSPGGCGWGVFSLAVWMAAAPAADPPTPNDPYFGSQWGLYNDGEPLEEGGPPGKPGADVRAREAWEIHAGTSSVVVAIVGTGVDPHPEYADRLLEGFATVGDPYNSLDLGPAGAVGTHVAGIIGAATDNGAGIAGLGGAVRLLPVRVVDNPYPTQGAVAEGITRAVDNGADIVVVPMQFYTGTAELENAVSDAFDAGVLVIAPAGGDASPVVAYPARYERCLAVAATTHADDSAAFSNYGPEVDLSAPGQDIVSTWSGGGYVNQVQGWRSAAGFAAGVAALVLSYAPGLSAGDLKDILISSADDLGDVAGWDEHFGAGRLNAEQALTLALPFAPALRFEEVDPYPTTLVPGAPTTFTIRIASVTEMLVPCSAMLFYRVSPGSFSSVPLVPLGNDLFLVGLPGTPCGATLEYYLSAAGEADGGGGTTVTEPLDAPASLHSAYAIREEALLHDDFELDHGWGVVVEGGPDTYGVWERVVPIGTEQPVGTIVQPGFDRSPNAGAYCYVTGQHDGEHAGTNDVDGGPVRLLSPVIVIDSVDIEVSYARWFHSSVGKVPDELIVELSRDVGASWTTVEIVTATAGWEYHSFRLSEFPEVTGDRLQVRFSVEDQPPDVSLTEAAIDEFHVRAILCAAATGDFDGDGAIDLGDYGHLSSCITGPGIAWIDGRCTIFDFDDDGDVDLDDGRAFQNVFDLSGA